jgi:hypothetical protein
MMLFRMVEILFELFIGNNNGELRKITVIPSSQLLFLHLNTQLLFLF